MASASRTAKGMSKGVPAFTAWPWPLRAVRLRLAGRMRFKLPTPEDGEWIQYSAPLGPKHPSVARVIPVAQADEVG